MSTLVPFEVVVLCVDGRLVSNIPYKHFLKRIDYVHVREGRLVYLQVQDKTIWLKTSEAGLVEAGSNPSLESLEGLHSCDI
jgi:hypothetical protein